MLNNIVDTVTSEHITIHLDAQIFNQSGILKCGYWYTQSYLFTIEKIEGYYRVTLSPLPEKTISHPDMVYTKLRKDLIDFQLRDVITKETQNIRDLLIAKAFANGALDEVSQEELSDPVE